ncbi:hypothetical protein [Nostoc sp. 'Peltigera membranacea cyanobiont' 213]|uniref:hypothetical protein n=1 Tax=Nostoc sp. 'Peltigera membranacea cyanobiont' 213 TaxID=2014530 RepID=UPI001180625D|nr:hypothetical protein [Nostoc sp. 'Peltigera membranacea cyanobiont' 213]
MRYNIISLGVGARQCRALTGVLKLTPMNRWKPPIFEFTYQPKKDLTPLKPLEIVFVTVLTDSATLLQQI